MTARFVRLTLAAQEFYGLADGKISGVLAEKAHLVHVGDVACLILTDYGGLDERYPLGSFLVADVTRVDLEFLPEIGVSVRSGGVRPPPEQSLKGEPKPEPAAKSARPRSHNPAVDE